MGGAGSGRKPKPVITQAEAADLEIGVDAASRAAALMPDPAAKKQAAKEAKGGAIKKAKKPYPKPSQFKDNPLAQAINGFASAQAKVPGLAEKCELGESYMAVMDYYAGGVIDHPLAIAMVATGNFAVMAYMIRGQQKQEGPNALPAVPGPGSPSGPLRV